MTISANPTVVKEALVLSSKFTSLSRDIQYKLTSLTSAWLDTAFPGGQCSHSPPLLGQVHQASHLDLSLAKIQSTINSVRPNKMEYNNTKLVTQLLLLNNKHNIGIGILEYIG